MTRRSTWIHLALILAITAVAYLPSLDNGFTNWDDPQYVYENPYVAHPDLGAILTTPIAANYHPLTILSLAANYRMSGYDARSYHVVNLFLHLANTALVFVFVWMLSGGRRWTTILTALLFGVHPTHVESVAWISERKDVLYAFFYLAGLIAYLRLLESRRWWWWAATSAAFLASLASKPAAVVFPIALLLIDAYRGRPWSRRLVLEKAGWLAASVAAGLLTVRAQAAGGALAEHWDPLRGLVTAAYGLGMYVAKLVAPVRLSVIYPPPWSAGEGPGPMVYAVAAAVAIAIPLLLTWTRRHRPARFGLAFFFVNLVLVLQFVAVGKAAMADRYTYLPYVGLVFALAWPLDGAPARSRLGSIATRALAVGFLALAPICVMETYARCDVWQNTETLWNDTIRKYPDRAVDAYLNRGYYYHKARRQYAKALADYDKAIAIDPSSASAWNNRGMLLADLGRPDSAVASLDRAIAIQAAYEQAWNNRGGIRLKMGDLAGGLADISRAIELNPGFRDAYANRAIGHGLAGEPERAIDDARRAVDLAPTHPDNFVLYGLMGTSSLELNRNREAISFLNDALRLTPAGDSRRGGFYLARSQAWAAVGDRARAVDDAREAMRLDPAIGEAYRRATGDGSR